MSRAIPCLPGTWGFSIPVSIRARFMSRAIRGWRAGCSADNTDRFNPRPVYEPGDTSLYPIKIEVVKCFNPRPVYEPGDTAIAVIRMLKRIVSIRARFMSRAIPGLMVSSGSSCTSFNPRPVYEPGDTPSAGYWATPRPVSIRARFMSRAIPPNGR